MVDENDSLLMNRRPSKVAKTSSSRDFTTPEPPGGAGYSDACNVEDSLHPSYDTSSSPEVEEVDELEEARDEDDDETGGVPPAAGSREERAGFDTLPAMILEKIASANLLTEVDVAAVRSWLGTWAPQHSSSPESFPSFCFFFFFFFFLTCERGVFWSE